MKSRDKRNVDDSDEVEMTESFIVEQCQLHRGYRTPELNEKLYLHHFGFSALKNLHAYTGCKVLYISNNAISDLRPLAALTLLDTLYASNNAIRSLDCLPNLPSLRLLDVSHNYLCNLVGISAVSSLETLLASHNAIHTLGNELQELRMLSSLDVSYNKLSDLKCVNEELSKLSSSLCTLILIGNSMIHSVSNYRKRTIHAFPNLRFLDEYPIFPDERAKAEAFANGGVKAEQELIKKLGAEKDAERHEQFKYFSAAREEARKRHVPGKAVPTTQYYEDHKVDDVFIPS